MNIINTENNEKLQKILKSCNDLYKNIGADRDKFLEISDNLREQKEFQNEISTVLKEFAGNNNDKLDEEL